MLLLQLLLAGCESWLCTCLDSRLPCSLIPIWLRVAALADCLLQAGGCCNLAADLPGQLAARPARCCLATKLPARPTDCPISVCLSVRLAGLARRLAGAGRRLLSLADAD